VLLSQISEKWFPNELKAMRLKDDGNIHFERSEFKKAVAVYSQAFELAPSDHLLVSNRSYAHACLGSYKNALSDAEIAIKIKPDWPKGYYRRGNALSGLGQHEEAAYSYLQCLTLDSSVLPARKSLAKSLHLVLSPLPPEDVKRAELQTYLNPTRLTKMINANNAGIDDGMHVSIDEETLLNLKESLKLTLKKDGILKEDATEQLLLGDKCSITDGLKPLFQSNTVHSAPNSACASPLMARKIFRSKSDVFPGAEEKLSNLSRKRSNECLSEASNDDTPPSPTHTSAPAKHARNEVNIENQRDVPLELRNKDDFECTLCYRLLYHPVTTPCGHVFCRQCLDRCLDHNTMCPLCKSSLVEYLAERRQAATEAVENILLAYLPTEFAERKQLHEEEITALASVLSEDTREVPIFICTLAYPKVLCPLHIFEPRYRLMVRQCMESGTRQFGMCVCLEEGETFAGFGTLLEIRDVQYFPDGRSVVDTMGGRRFKVLSRGQRDGFDTARIQLISDNPRDEAEEEEVKAIHDKVHKEATDWFASLPRIPKLRILQHFGEFPDVEPSLHNLPDGPAWAWWLTAVLPLDQRAQLTIIAMTSLRDRLAAINRVLTYVQRKSTAQ